MISCEVSVATATQRQREVGGGRREAGFGNWIWILESSIILGLAGFGEIFKILVKSNREI